MSDIAQAIQEWKNKALSPAALLRRIAGHGAWQLPISEAAAQDTLATNSLDRILYNRDDSGRARLLVFSSDETLKTYADVVKSPTAMHFLRSPGDWAFSVALEDAIDEVILDPASPHQFVISGPSVKALRSTAQAVRVEKALQRLRDGNAEDGDVKLAATYQDYVIAIAKSTDDDMQLCHAPDNQGRVMAAVFTHNDAADLALDEMQAQCAPKTVSTLLSAGPRLFHMLGGMQNLTGIVFNFSGPEKPVAFAAGISAIMVEEAAK